MSLLEFGDGAAAFVAALLAVVLKVLTPSDADSSAGIARGRGRVERTARLLAG